MEHIPKNELLLQKCDSLYEIRKMYNLHNAERLKESLDIIEDWVKKQNHFLKKDFSRDFYQRTLISCKGSVEKTKRTIDRLCTMRTFLPKFFSVTNVKIEVSELMDIGGIYPIPKMTEDYHRIILLKINSKNIENRHFLQYYQFCVSLAEYLKRHDYTNGFIIIEDFRQVNIMELLTKINLVELQQFMTILVEGYGARIKAVYLLSESKAIEILANTVKRFLTEKIGKRLKTVSSMEEIYKLVPIEFIPEDYGGTEKPSHESIMNWIEALSTEDHVAYLKMMHSAGTDETRRRAEKFNEDYMGMPGSFRSLTVD